VRCANVGERRRTTANGGERRRTAANGGDRGMLAGWCDRAWSLARARARESCWRTTALHADESILNALTIHDGDRLININRS
jgi:hypothetical protein